MVLLLLITQAFCGFERDVSNFISDSWQSRPVDFFMKGVHVTCNPVANAVSPGLFYFVDDKITAKQDFVGFLTNCATIFPLKYVVNRQRPEGTTPRWNSSFPSGHTAFIFTQAVIIAHHYPDLKYPVFLHATAVGISRIYLKRHFPTDVIAGAALGLLTGYLTIKIVE